MILRRLGNKSKIAKEIYKYFPKHDTRIILFFGAGGDFFNMPKAKYTFMNDYDNNVYLCFDVLMRRKSELIDYIEKIPIHQSFWKEAKKRQPDNEIEKVVYFLLLSNFGYMGKPDTIMFGLDNSKSHLLTNIEKSYKILVENSNKFLNEDFRNVIKKIHFRHFS
jgi:DNA adenine methylase